MGHEHEYERASALQAKYGIPKDVPRDAPSNLKNCVCVCVPIMQRHCPHWHLFQNQVSYKIIVHVFYFCFFKEPED
jgi:hypothetical protein